NPGGIGVVLVTTTAALPLAVGVYRNQTSGAVICAGVAGVFTIREGFTGKVALSPGREGADPPSKPIRAGLPDRRGAPPRALGGPLGRAWWGPAGASVACTMPKAVWPAVSRASRTHTAVPPTTPTTNRLLDALGSAQPSELPAKLLPHAISVPPAPGQPVY